MADWFETRFRDPGGAGDVEVDPDFAARLRALVVEAWEADVDPTAPPDPDPDQHGGDVIMLETQDPEAPDGARRRTRTRWLQAAAAVAAIAAIGVGAYVAGDDDEELGTADAPAPPATAIDLATVSGDLAPGTYWLDPDGDPATPLKVTFTVTADGWSMPWFGAVKEGRSTLSITTVTNLVGDSCAGDAPADPPVGPTVDDLATALAELAPFEVAEAPDDVVVDGYEGSHLTLRTASGSSSFPGCQDGRLYSWISPLNGDGPDDLDGGVFSGYNGGDVEDFWIVDVEGTRLVLQTWTSSPSAPGDAAELQAMVDSVRIYP